MKINSSDLKKATKKILVELAKKASIRKYSSLSKQELIKVLTKEIIKKAKEISSQSVSSEQPTAKIFKESKKNLSVQEEISVSKYAVDIDTLPKPFLQEHDGIPHGYGVNRIVLMVRDPFWVHTYWEITLDQISRVREHIDPGQRNQTRLVLRLMDVTDTDPKFPNNIQYTDVMLESRNWYLNVPSSDRAYCVEIGYLCSDGSFYALARSNTVRTPRAGMSNIFDEKWMSIEDYDRLYVLSGGLGIGLSSMDLMGTKGQVLRSDAYSGSASQMCIPEQQTKKDFFLSADTELVLYGKTIPGSVISFGGVEKKAGPDGSFSIRFQLKQGEHVIPLTARSADGNQEKSVSIKIKQENA